MERENTGSGRVYVLGAGASVFGGYPLAPELLSFIRNFRTLEVRTQEIATEVLGKLAEAETLFARSIVRNPNGTANLEKLLTYLELYRTFPGRMFDNNPWSERDSNCVRRVICDRFLFYQYDLCKCAWGTERPVEPISVDPDLVRKVADAWATCIQPGDTVLTFNWDILHEVILWREGKWSYRDGYGFEIPEQGHLEERSKSKLLKLHGSVNWVQREPSESVSEIANVPDFFPGARDYDWRSHVNQAQADSGRKLVLPTYLKDISSNLVLLDLWTQAHSALSHAKELIIVGYSLHPVDHPARLLFGTSLSQNTGLTHVKVVSPDANHWATFLDTIGKKLEHVRQRFDEWLLAD